MLRSPQQRLLTYITNNPPTKSSIVIYKISLKNSPRKVLLDAHVYEHLNTDPYYKSLRFLDNLREHSSGCAVFQKSWKRPDGSGYHVETIYLHKLIAEKWLTPPTPERRYVIALNEDKLDCRIANLEWRTKSAIARRSKPIGRVPYRGVSRDRLRYRSEIYYQGKRIYLGAFKTPEEASAAYQKKARELFGENADIKLHDDRNERFNAPR